MSDFWKQREKTLEVVELCIYPPPGQTPQTTEAGSTHPTGMHSYNV